MSPAATPVILFEDQHLAVLSKPAGLLSQGEESGSDNLVNWLKKYFGRNYVGLIHRLDRNTSGIMVVAKRSKAAARLSQALRTDKLQRNYLAWLHGKLEAATTWQHWLVKDRQHNITKVVNNPTPEARQARLSVCPERYSRWQGNLITLATFQLATGRSHQIRVQAAHEGHALLGDTKYGAKMPPFRRLALHSHRLAFPHPMSGAPLEFVSPLPPELEL